MQRLYALIEDIGRATGKVEQGLFNPETRYGLCSGCGKRAVTCYNPALQMICEKRYPAAGWGLVHEGPDQGWHRQSVSLC